MKSAYEIAMERLNKTAPQAKLSAEQKQEIADLESRYAAKVAEREITLKGEIARAEAAGDTDEAESVRKQLAHERAKLQAELEDKKESVRRR